MRKLFFAISFLICISTSYAQLYEGGLFIGGSNYIGDVGSTNYILPKRLALGAVAKFNFSPRITFKGTFKYSKLLTSSGSEARPITLPQGSTLFDSTELAEGAVGVEFSFFKYSLSKIGYTNTPFINVQFGLAYYTRVTDAIRDPGTNTLVGFSTTRSFSPVLPFGLGYKMKLSENIGLSFETTFTYTFRDDIDRNNHDIPELSFGNPNSDDWYVFTGISIVYAFGRPGCYTGVF